MLLVRMYVICCMFVGGLKKYIKYVIFLWYYYKFEYDIYTTYFLIALILS